MSVQLTTDECIIISTIITDSTLLVEGVGCLFAVMKWK
jgi:hypothetical protein